MSKNGFLVVLTCMPNFIKTGGGQDYFGLFLVDFIWNYPCDDQKVRMVRAREKKISEQLPG